MERSHKIKIAHLIDSAGIAGGERYLLDLIRHSDPSFEHFVILSSAGPFERMLKDQNCRYVFISMERKISCRSIRKIRQFIHEEKINIVHTHGYRANLYGRSASLLTDVSHIATIHVSLYDYLDTPAFIRRIYLLIEKMMSFRTSKYICISAAMRHDLLKMGIKNEKIIVIHNGVDLDIFHPRQADGSRCDALGISENNPVIGTVGRMVTEKGQIYLIEALSHLQDKWPMLRCLFIGTGPLRAQLKNHADNLGVADMCIFTGVRTDIADIYPLMDIFVLPSIREPFGLVLLEAMASRVPVIATASGGPLDFIESGVNGILVAPSNPGELAAQVYFLLSKPDQAEAMAQRGYDVVRENYGIKETATRVYDVYRSIAWPMQ
jgi:glycosyltransferase involved in cell wall biosynthesis